MAIAKDPAKPLDWFIDVALLVLAGLSGPFVIFTVPLFVFRAWRLRSRPSFVLLAIVINCALTQGWFVAHAPPDREIVG